MFMVYLGNHGFSEHEPKPRPAPRPAPSVVAKVAEPVVFKTVKIWRRDRRPADHPRGISRPLYLRRRTGPS